MIPRLLSPAAESGSAPEKLLSGYEEGMRLVKVCGDRLADAEQKVEILSKAVTPEPAKAAATEAPAKPAEDIKLF